MAGLVNTTRIVNTTPITSVPVAAPRASTGKFTRKRAYLWGLEAETIAAWMLRLKGYSILERRHKTPYGEIDLIAARAGVRIFVEVKGRRNLDAAAFAVTARQQRRIVQAAEYWRMQNSLTDCEFDYRFDVVLMAPGCSPRHMVNAFWAQ